jgi:hypothetical protein
MLFSSPVGSRNWQTKFAAIQNVSGIPLLNVDTLNRRVANLDTANQEVSGIPLNGIQS